MNEIQNRLRDLMEHASKLILNYQEFEMCIKPSPEKWSKKEILGHLLDSGINNLQRFTTIQFESKPFKIDPYSQKGLVDSNDYQNSNTIELLEFWIAINRRIIHVFGIQTQTTLNFEIVLPNGDKSDLKFLMIDYVDHLEHHLNQILA
ncbi:DinB family protein [uncultured Algibacter sp.]|uniref:DinB family protein n=1 Tax=uncultured Algibacter sp. TaxID=298659 RepID=UPI002636C015|nr:DinB family protein [uncultured Algibacter sp.]